MRRGNTAARRGFRPAIRAPPYLGALAERATHGPVTARSSIRVIARLNDNGDFGVREQVSQRPLDGDADQRPRPMALMVWAANRFQAQSAPGLQQQPIGVSDFKVVSKLVAFVRAFAGAQRDRPAAHGAGD